MRGTGSASPQRTSRSDCKNAWARAEPLTDGESGNVLATSTISLQHRYLECEAWDLGILFAPTDRDGSWRKLSPVSVPDFAQLRIGDVS